MENIIKNTYNKYNDTPAIIRRFSKLNECFFIVKETKIYKNN